MTDPPRLAVEQLPEQWREEVKKAEGPSSQMIMVGYESCAHQLEAVLPEVLALRDERDRLREIILSVDSKLNLLKVAVDAGATVTWDDLDEIEDLTCPMLNSALIRRDERDRLRTMLSEFCQRERGLIETRGKGGQHVGRSPSITPSVLKELEWMLNNSALIRADAPPPEVDR